MVAEISVKGDLQELKRHFTRLERENLPFAIALSLTRTAAFVAGTKPYTNKGVMQRVLPQIFDQPARWTMRGFYIEPATKQRQTSAVRIKDDFAQSGTGTPAFNYLSLQQSGGIRTRAKGHEVQLRRLRILDDDEFTVPGKRMRLNRHGNLTAATYSKILADVDPFKDFSGIARGRGQATLKKGKRQYFYSPNIRPRGIYRRSGRNKIFPALLFVKAPKYQPIFPFEQIVRRSGAKRWPREFRDAMRAALKSSRRRRLVRRR